MAMKKRPSTSVYTRIESDRKVMNVATDKHGRIINAIYSTKDTAVYRASDGSFRVLQRVPGDRIDSLWVRWERDAIAAANTWQEWLDRRVSAMMPAREVRHA